MKHATTLSVLLCPLLAAGGFAADQVRTATGVVQAAGDSTPAVRMFKGIPYAQPPVGELRWKAPQPARGWTGVRPGDSFGPRCMQRSVFADMVFRSNGVSEDCLYLNVWTPAKSDEERLPVLVYFFGGGFMAGDGSEPRYDGASMASKGIVTVTVNYRLGVFGFLAHAELSQEAPYMASGNYGLLDQSEALHWVSRNIAAFGGDPKRVTIAGESAGSISVSGQVVSPLSKDLIAGGILESGSLIGSLSPQPLAAAERDGATFSTSVGASSLVALRAISAEQLLEAAAKPTGVPRFRPTFDGYFLPKPVPALLEAGAQARVPLLGGSNSEEMPAQMLLQKDDPTPDNYAKAVRALYGDKAGEVLRLYPGSSEQEVLDSATALASDRFIGFSTWRFLEGHRKTGQPVYRYFYARPRPKFLGGYPESPGGPPAAPQPPARGAAHSAEIEYAMGNLAMNPYYEWEPADHKVSEVMQGYFVNFVKTGNPNGPGLPTWPAYGESDGFQVLRIDVDSRAEPEKTRPRYLLLEPLMRDEPGPRRGR